MTKRYTELADYIVKRIKDGELPIGSKLPNEIELSRNHNVSRTTVRSALNIIEGLGLIERRRRIGTVVISNTTEKSYTKSLSNIEDLVHYAKYTHREIKGAEEIVCDALLAAELSCKAGQRWHRIQMLRVETDRKAPPVCWTNAYLLPEMADVIVPLIPNGTGLICHLVESNIGRSVRNVKQEITARILSADIAHILQVEEGSLGLVVYRHYFDQSKDVFLITESIYPTDRFKFTLWLHRSQL